MKYQDNSGNIVEAAQSQGGRHGDLTVPKGHWIIQGQHSCLSNEAFQRDYKPVKEPKKIIKDEE